MKVTQFTKDALAYRRERETMLKNGYHEIEMDWKLHRGAKVGHKIKFFDAKVSCNGKNVWIKVETEEVCK